MEYEALMALIDDAGGVDNITSLIFDNAIHVSFVKAPQESKLRKGDFKNLGGTWFYVEPSVFRSNTDFDYNVPGTIYHPLECLQAVITCDTPNKLDIISMNDMLSQVSS